jgi:hypothetical protein
MYETQAMDFSLSGNLLAVSSGESVVMVDLSHPSLPHVRGNFYASRMIQDVALSGTTLQVISQGWSSEPSGATTYLGVLDVTDPTDPAEIGALNLGSGGVSRAALVSDGLRTYVAANRLSVVGLDDLFQPQLLGALGEPTGFHVIAKAGTVALLGAGSQLSLVSVADPALPIHLGQYTAEAVINKVVVSGQYAVLVEGLGNWEAGQFEVVNIANPAAPQHVVTQPVTDAPYLLDAVAEGDLLYVLAAGTMGDGIGGLRILDISDPLHPVPRSTTMLNLYGSNVGSRLALAGNRLVVSNSTPMDAEPNDTRSTAVDLGTLAAPAVVWGGFASSLDESDYYRFHGAAGDHVTIDWRGHPDGIGSMSYTYVNLFDANGDQLASAYGTVGPEFADFELPATGDYYVQVVPYYYGYIGNYQLALASNGAVPPARPTFGPTGYDVSDPAHPAVAFVANVNAPSQTLAAEGSTVYLTLSNPPLLGVLDVSAPNPELRAAAQLTTLGPIAVSGGLALIAGGRELQIVDVVDPLRPVTLESYQAMQAIGGLAVEGPIAFLAADSLYNVSLLADVTTPDLAVTAVNAAGAVQLGSALPVSWTVRNQGRQPAEGSWTDAVYLSTDAVLDGGDTPLGTVAHAGPLNSATQYTGQLNAVITGIAPGQYYAIVRTDILNDVNEYSIEANNVRVSAQTVYVGYPDLTVTHLAVPALIQKGDLLSIDWTVFNRDLAPAGGDWNDKVYLSTDAAIDPATDVLVATVPHTGGLAPRTVYRGSAEIETSTLTEGTYFVGVVTDADLAVPENGNEGNNVRVSSAFRLGVPALTLGTAQTDVFAQNGQARYYRVAVDAGASLFVTLNDANDQGANELYIKYGAVPTRTDFDAKYSRPLAADQQVRIPDTQAGTYYVLAYGAGVPDAPGTFSLTASLMDFSLAGLSPITGGNVGNVTVSIRGAQFSEDILPVLVAPSGARYFGGDLYWVDSGQFYATFNLAGAAVGAYDLRLERPDGVFAEAQDIFQVQAGTGADLFAELVLPGAVRAGRQFTIDIVYGNRGDTDMISPLLTLYGPANQSFGLTADQVDGVGTLRLLGYSASGPAGILQPGDTERITLYATASNTPGMQDYRLTSQSVDPLNPSVELIDWAALESQYRPPFATDATWGPIWETFTTQIGATWDEVIATLAWRVTEVPHHSLPNILVDDLMQEQLQMALSRGGGLTDTEAPWVMRRSIGLAADGSGVDRVDVTFSETIDEATFTAADVVMTDPLDQPVTPVTVTKVNERTYRIRFSPQGPAGQYHVWLGPEIQDQVGLKLDQDRDGTPGEQRDDRFDAGFVILFGVAPPAADPLFVTFHTPAGEVDQAEGVDRVVVSFSKQILAFSFDATDVSLIGPAGAVPVLGVGRLSPTDYEITFPRQDTVGTYTLGVGPSVLGLNQQPMDQDLDGTPGEAGQDRYVGTFEIVDRRGPQVVSQYPSGPVRGPIAFLDVVFDEPIDAASFTPADVVLTGPDGTIAVTDVSPLGGNGFRITFDSQTKAGDYALTVGPNITDLQRNPMNQDGDDTNGEVTDVYSGAFEVLPPKLIVQGTVTYTGGLEKHFPGAIVGVQLWEQNGARDPEPGEPTGGDAADQLISRENRLTHSALTTAEGKFVFAYDVNGNPIENVDPETGGGARDLYVVVFAQNKDAFVVQDGTATADSHAFQPLWTWVNPEPVAGHPAGWPTNEYARRYHAAIPATITPATGPQVVNFPVTVNTAAGQDDEFWLAEWVRYGAEWVRSQVKVAPRRSIALFNNYTHANNAAFNTGRDVIRVHPTEFGFPATVLHEYGHAIHHALTDYVGNDPYDDTSDYGVMQEGSHEGTTISEGWASFFAAKVLDGVNVPRSVLDQNRSGAHLETNEFWMGPDGFGKATNAQVDDSIAGVANLPPDGINDNANSGDIVMGAVMSIFWDIADPRNDDQVSDLRGLWNWFDTAAIDGSVRGVWTRSTQSNAVASIFIDHGVDVKDDAGDTGANPNDVYTAATDLRTLEGPYTYPKPLIMAEKDAGKGDWFTFQLPKKETDPTKAKKYSVTIQVKFEARYGDLDLSVWEDNHHAKPKVAVNRGGGVAEVTFDDLTNDREYKFDVFVAGHGAISAGGGPESKGGDYNPNYSLTINVNVPPPEKKEDEKDKDQNQVVRAVDPNDKVGPAGVGTAHFILPGSIMPFTIYYENDPNAGATVPAQVVRIEDTLDADLDWATFELGPITLFDGFVVPVPTGLSQFETTVDLRPENNLLVHVTAGLDAATGKVTWTFESLDPDTLAAPDDPFAGFLPVNNKDLHNGEGHVSYLIHARADLKTDAEITNQAFNYFDTNEAVPTPTTHHKIDAGLPTGSVSSLPAELPDGPFPVSWSGQDDTNGSGIATHTIYVKEDDGPWQVWLRDTALTTAEFTGLGGHRYAFRSVATDLVGHVEADPGTEEAFTQLDFSQFRVQRLEATPSGLVAYFRRPLDLSTLNLYDGLNETGKPANLGPADMTVVGATVGPVAGSLVYDPVAKTVTFIKTGGPLAPDTYTVTLRGAADGFRDTDGHLLDGNNDNQEGGNFVTTVTVAAGTARVVGLSDFARGPGQAVNVPATASGIPLTISNAEGALAMSFTLTYDPALLSVTDVVLGAGLPEDWGVEYNLSTPGQVPVVLYGATPLAAGARTLARVQAAVPGQAAYRSAALLGLRNLLVNDGAIPSVADTGLQVVAYLGDATGNGRYSALDASYVARVAVGADSGFAAYRLKDPVVIGDATANGAVSALDASYVARKIVGRPQPEIPDLPANLPPIVISGPDPLITLPQIAAAPGDVMTRPVTVDNAAGLLGVDLHITYDTAVLDLSDSDIQLGGVLAGWSLATVVNDASGDVRVTIFTAGDPLPAGGGDLLQITYHVRSDAPTAGSPLHLVMDGSHPCLLNEGTLVMTPADGAVTMVTNHAPTAVPSLPDQTAYATAAFQFAVPAGTFTDEDAGDHLTLSARLGDGSPLPAWLSFNSATGQFQGTPAKADSGVLVVRVTAADTGSPPLTASTVFTLTVVGAAWQNPRNPLDVDDKGTVIPLDVLLLINDINANKVRRLPVPPPVPGGPPPYLDVNGDGFITPLDVVIVINYLNSRQRTGGEGDPLNDWNEILDSLANDRAQAEMPEVLVDPVFTELGRVT